MPRVALTDFDVCLCSSARMALLSDVPLFCEQCFRSAALVIGLRGTFRSTGSMTVTRPERIPTDDVREPIVNGTSVPMRRLTWGRVSYVLLPSNAQNIEPPLLGKRCEFHRAFEQYSADGVQGIVIGVNRIPPC